MAHPNLSLIYNVAIQSVQFYTKHRNVSSIAFPTRSLVVILSNDICTIQYSIMKWVNNYLLSTKQILLFPLNDRKKYTYTQYKEISELSL